ncbi:hypothetical protein EDB85DRAFT_2296180 [Lactarius pseudohatsudake]|nr:hypothetical protein EDB85DRAFT_2296180 [Lactarius pseudohatsudake]
MSHLPTTNATDSYAFPVWPDSEGAASEEFMAWARAIGCAQSGPSMENVYFDDLLDTTALASGLSRTTPAELFGFQNDSGTNWTSGGAVATDILSHGIPLPGATVTVMDTTSTIAPATMPPLPTDNMDAFVQGFFFTQPDFSTSFSGTPYISSLPSPQSDDTRGGVLQFPTFETTSSSYLARPPGLPFPQLITAGAMGPNQIAGVPPTWFMGDSNLAGPVQSDYGPIIDPVTTNSAPLDYTQLIDYLTTPADSLAAQASETVPAPSLGKKRRRQSGEDESGTPKRGRPCATRVLGGAESTKRTPRFPATRTRQSSNSISKATGRGAERLASTTARGLYHRSLPGLSVSQGSMGALEQEQPSWIEEREQMEARYDVGSPVPLQSVENAGEKLYKIPGKLTERERLMLQTTQADEERGAVRVIKCRVCPEREFGGWATFRRHCNSCEKHPSALQFCSKCGDYFGRPDSENRHKGKKYQGACLSTSQDEAKQKEQKVRRLLKAFEARLKHCLRTGEDIRPLFSDVVTKKLTNTSKKVSKAEETWVEGSSWADGL